MLLISPSSHPIAGRETFDLRLEIRNVACLGTGFQTLRDSERRLPCCRGHLFVTCRGSGVAQRCLAGKVAGCDGDSFTGQDQCRRWLFCGKQRLTPLRKRKRGDLRHREGALVDEHGVVNRCIGMTWLKGSIGIELTAGPLTSTEVSGADQNGTGDRGRNDVRATEPLRVYGGECVTANTVDARINLRPCEVRKPTLLVRVMVLPLLHLQELLGPI